MRILHTNRLLRAAFCTVLAIAMPSNAQNGPDASLFPDVGQSTKSVTGLALPMPQAAITTTPLEATPSRRRLVRNYTLEELGHENGLQFSQLSGELRLFFPVPDQDAIDALTLNLDLHHASALKTERFLQVLVDGTALQVVPLLAREGGHRVSVPVPVHHVRGGFLRVTLRYGGGAANHRCIDRRVAGDFLRVAESSHLQLAVKPDSPLDVADFAALQPRQVNLALDSDFTDQQFFTQAMQSSAVLGAQYGHVTFADTPDTARNADGIWRQSSIRVRTAGAAEASLIRVHQTEGLPELEIAATQPHAALAVIERDWAGLAQGPVILPVRAALAPADPDRLALGVLANDLEPRGIIGRGDTVIDFPVDAVPAGRRPTELVLLVSAAPDPSGDQVYVSATLNDTLLGGGAVGFDGVNQLVLPVPPSVLHLENRLRLIVQRQALGGDCSVEPQSYAVQVLPESHFLLEKDTRPPADFASFSHAVSQDVKVFVALAEGEARADALPWLAPVVGALVPGRANIQAVIGQPDLTVGAPFIYYGSQLPPRMEADVAFDDDATRIQTREGTTLFEGVSLDALGAVQLVQLGSQTGVWIRPGTGQPPAPTDRRPVLLDRGDLAFLGERGVVLATTTRTPSLVEVVQPGRLDLMILARQYRVWIVGGLWILALLFLFGGAQRLVGMIRRKDGPGPAGDDAA